MELVAAGIGHSYGEIAALADVSLTVADGEILALIGPSGCGKSTLLGILGGMLHPSMGQVSIRGALPAGTLNPFTYMFQDFALLPWRTVEANVMLPLEHHAMDAAEKREQVRAALALTGLAEFAQAFPKQLSGGMRQRVGIARALVVKPAILLMDEPLSALDAQTRDILADELLAIWRRERTTGVYVTHNLHEALRLADRVAVLSRRPGRLKAVIPVPIPKAERERIEHAGELARLHEKLWSLIRDEAVVADREMQRG